MQNKPSFFRRKFLIEPRFQFTIIALITLPVILVWIIFYLGLRFVLTPIILQRVGSDNSFNSELIQLNTAIQNNFDLIFFIHLASCLLFLIPFGIIVTNRLAGPMYRLKKFLSEKQTGPFPKFRKTDFFGDLPELIEKYVNDKKAE